MSRFATSTSSNISSVSTRSVTRSLLPAWELGSTARIPMSVFVGALDGSHMTLGLNTTSRTEVTPSWETVDGPRRTGVSGQLGWACLDASAIAIRPLAPPCGVTPRKLTRRLRIPCQAVEDLAARSGLDSQGNRIPLQNGAPKHDVQIFCKGKRTVFTVVYIVQEFFWGLPPASCRVRSSYGGGRTA